MKKILLLAIALGGLLSGCTSSDGPILPTADGEEYSLLRTEKELMAIAEEAPGLFDEEQSRSTRKVSKLLIPVSTSNSRSEDEAEVYAINFEDGQGFVLVTDNREIDGLLAYVPEGNYSDELLDIPSFSTIIGRPTIPTDSIATPVPYPGLDPDPDPNPGDDGGTQKRRLTETTTTKTIVENYPRKVKKAWGQGIPANLFFPNYVAGCGPVAAGQVMCYVQPPQMTLSFPEADTYNVVFNWKDISKHFNDHETYQEECLATDEAHKQIAYLCREIAHRANATFGFFATGTTPNGIYYALTSLFSGYCTIAAPKVYSSAVELENSLKDDVCIMFAADKYEVLANHAFLVDGYKVVNIKEVCKWRYEDDLLWHILWENEKTNTYYHVNWGWNGKGNGYFSRNVLNPTRPEELDLPSKPSDVDAEYSKDIVYISVHKK